MKNSTAKSSTKASKKEAKPSKPMVRKLAGLVFPPPKNFPHTVFMSLLEWVEAKGPDDAYVFDSVEVLHTANIPVRDATFHRGIYTCITPRKPVETVVNKARLRNLSSRGIIPKAKVTVVKGIQAANTKDHHKMSY